MCESTSQTSLAPEQVTHTELMHKAHPEHVLSQRTVAILQSTRPKLSPANKTACSWLI